MALTKQPVVLTNPAGPTYQVAVGPEAYAFDREQLRAIYNGLRDLDFLLFQFVVTLQQAGVNPGTATLAQIKAALEAQTYWWGN
jgi:hypothetical protein